MDGIEVEVVLPFYSHPATATATATANTTRTATWVFGHRCACHLLYGVLVTTVSSKIFMLHSCHCCNSESEVQLPTKFDSPTNVPYPTSLYAAEGSHFRSRDASAWDPPLVQPCFFSLLFLLTTSPSQSFGSLLVVCSHTEHYAAAFQAIGEKYKWINITGQLVLHETYSIHMIECTK